MKRMSLHAVTVAALSLSLFACGDALTDDRYQGEPRFVLSGTLQSLDASATGAQSYVGVVWVNFAKDGDTVATQVASVSDAAFPSEFTLALYDQPADGDLNDFSDPLRDATGRIGTGFIVAFDDVDGDGLLTTPTDLDPVPGGDLLRGLAPEHIAIYARDVNDALRTLLVEENVLIVNPEAMVSGFNLARTVCAGPSDDFDRLEIVPNEAVTLQSMEYVDANDWLCLNFT